MPMPLEPLEPATVLFLLSMIDSRWAHKARVVSYVGAFHGGAWIGDVDVSAVVGRARGRAWKLLAELELERVILRRLQAGRRPAWCEVNPDVAEWRGVPWVHDPTTIEARLALHEKRQRATTTALERLVSRPIGARQPDLVARLIAARLAPFDTPLSRANETRHNGERVFASRAPMGRDTTDALSRAMGRGTSEAFPPTAVPRGNGHREVVVSDAGAFGEPTAVETVTVDEASLTAARRAVLQRTVADGRGRHFINGKPLVQLTALVVRYPLAQILEAAERAPAGELVPGFIGWLFDNIEPPAELELGERAPAPPAGVNPRWLEAKIVALRRQAEQCDAEGAPEVGDTYRAELAECENELAGLLVAMTGKDEGE